MRRLFRRFAETAARALGSPWAFLGAILIVVGWALAGPHFHYSETWQIVINTMTTIMTFLIVFLIQSTQNRDATAVHLKLDELLRALREARTGLVQLEKLSDEELATLQQEFTRLSKRERADHADGPVPPAPEARG